MDTLTENSANRNNTQSLTYRDSLRGPFQSPLTSEGGQSRIENMAGRVNPRYMTPTAASRAQVSTPEPRISTPPPSTSTGKRKAWMVSAAKRVGIVPGIPRSKKEGRVYKRISPRKGAAAETQEKSPYQVLIVFYNAWTIF
jgi:hypothetical protein